MKKKFSAIAVVLMCVSLVGAGSAMAGAVQSVRAMAAGRYHMVILLIGQPEAGRAIVDQHPDYRSHQRRSL